tara:strand:- start:603 stop:728 length:126 start_codon:yes stop_codon:yes gene_type:complete
MIKGVIKRKKKKKRSFQHKLKRKRQKRNIKGILKIIKGGKL